VERRRPDGGSWQILLPNDFVPRSAQDRFKIRRQCAMLIQKIHAAQFDRFKFLFHSFATATFATLCAKSSHSQWWRSHLVSVREDGRGNLEPCAIARIPSGTIFARDEL
jgi:hypothetical protein